jgi:predicted transglutaminase-like cysteine proteinase
MAGPEKTDVRADMAVYAGRIEKYWDNRRPIDQQLGATAAQPAQSTTHLDKLEQQARENLKNYSGNAKGEMAIVEVVDRLVNERIKYKNEKMDDWSPGAVTAQRGYGDCDDISLLKAELLVKMGIPAERVGMMTLNPKEHGKSGHAVGYYKSPDGQTYIMDNNEDRAANYSGVSPLYNYLKHHHNGMTYYPVTSYSMDGKTEVNQAIVNGQIAREDMEPRLPRQTLAEIEQDPRVRMAAVQVLAQATGVAPSNLEDFARHSPGDFARLLAEKLEDKKIQQSLSRDALDLMRNYADELSKANPPKDAPTEPTQKAPGTTADLGQVPVAQMTVRRPSQSAPSGMA